MRLSFIPLSFPVFIVLFWRRVLAQQALWLAFALNTILDKIIEFVKSSFGSNFVSEQRFDTGASVVRLTQMRSRFLACLNGRPQEVNMSRRGQTRFMHIGTPPCCVLQTVAPAAARFLRTSIKADTKSLGRILCQTDNRSAMSKLERTEIIKRAKWRFFANS